MENSTAPTGFQIKDWKGDVLFTSSTALNVAECLAEAVKAEANLYGASLVRANLEGASLVRANLEGANLYGASLVRANLEGANLEGANLEGANLEGANLYGANLYGANLEGANLEGANLEGANLEGANLVRANLEGANLVRANLYGANLYGAKIHGEDQTITPIQLLGLTWPALISRSSMQIGCQLHTHEEWRDFSDAKIKKMDGRALTFWQENKAVLILLCDAHHAKSEAV